MSKCHLCTTKLRVSVISSIFPQPPLIILVLVGIGVLSDYVIYYCKLPRPSRVIKKLSQVKSVVVRGVSFGMIRWGYCRHFVAIDRVVVKEAFDLGSNFAG